MSNRTILRVNNLKKYYHVTGGLIPKPVADIKAVDGVSFYIDQGEVLGLVGESGCGKSTLAKTILRLEEPTEGQIIFFGEDIIGLSRRNLRRLRGKMQIVFQDPDASLDPRMTVGGSIEEAFIIQGIRNTRERSEKVAWLLEKVGLEADFAERYPHEFSGGQKQRIGIARALAMDPRLIIADEPVSALDVSVQAQILNLMMDIKDRDGLTYLFISHDLSIIKYVSDRVAVMYLGKIIEVAAKHEFFANPAHPYSEALLSAVGQIGIERKERIILKGDMPSPISPPSGCRFHTRCHKLLPVCDRKEPELREIASGHYVACHLYN